jgi:hypothetical protein
VLATGSAAEFASPGIEVAVADDSTSVFTARATDANNNSGPCSPPQTYVEDSTVAAPTLSGTSPRSPANDESPRVHGAAEPGSTIRLFGDPACAGSPIGAGTSAELAGGGIRVTVPPDATTTIRGATTDGLGNSSACSAVGIAYREDSTAPETWIGRRKLRTRDRTPKIRFGSTEPGVRFACRIDTEQRFGCDSPLTPNRLSIGRHRVKVSAIDDVGNRDGTPAKARVKVIPRGR